jgi:hypothetical protein
VSAGVTGASAADRAVGVLLLEIVGGTGRFRVGEASALRTTVDVKRALVGRHADADVVVIDESRRVSRRHALIEQLGTGWWIRDWRSAHGTAVALASAAPQRLGPDVPQPLIDGLLVTLADAVTFRVRVISGISGGDTTVTSGLQRDGAASSFVLDPVLRAAADALTAPYREIPPRADCAGIERVMGAVGYGRSQTYELLRRLADHPAVAPHLATAPGERARHRDLARALTIAFPEFALPRSPLPDE